MADGERSSFLRPNASIRNHFTDGLFIRFFDPKRRNITIVPQIDDANAFAIAGSSYALCCNSLFPGLDTHLASVSRLATDTFMLALLWLLGRFGRLIRQIGSNRQTSRELSTTFFPAWDLVPTALNLLDERFAVERANVNWKQKKLFMDDFFRRNAPVI